MSKQLKSRISSLSMAILAGLTISAVAQAAVTSSPTITVKGRAPTITAPTVTYVDSNSNGIVDTGDTLTAVDGTFTDLDGDTKTASTYRWYNGTADIGINASYTIRVTDLGKTITLYIKANTDPLITDPAVSSEVSAAAGTNVAAGTTLMSVAITGQVLGNPQVASALTASPTCLTTCGTVNYQWQLETAVNSGLYSNIAGAASVSYTPLKTDQKRKIQVVAN